MASFEKRANGMWSCRFRETDENGVVHNRRLPNTYKTKREAQYAYEDYLKSYEERQAAKIAEQEANKPQAPLPLTFDELVEKFLVFQKPRVKDTSFYAVNKNLAKITPFFSGMAAKDITPLKILEWMDTVAEYSFTYRKNMLTQLSTVFNYAEKYYDIPNVVKKVDRPRNLEAKKEMLVWSPEEFAKMISKVNRRDYAELYRFLYLTGCRRGEALALTWEDIDLERQTATISKSVAFKPINNKPYQITTPKNAGSNRTISLPDQLVQSMTEYREWQKSTCEKNNRTASFVFGYEDPLPSTSIERYMTQAANDAGVKRIRIHDLRHSCASLLIHKGVSIVAVSRRLGHTSIEQTLNTYSHMMPDDQTAILNALNGLPKL